MTIDHLQVPPRDAALSPPRATSRLPRVYVGLWAGLSALSAVYLTLAAFDGADLSGARSRQQGVAMVPQSEVELRVAENRKLRDAMTEFQADVGHIKSDLEQRGGATDIVGALSAVEERASLETGRPVQRRIAAMDLDQPKPQALPSTAALETGSIQPPQPLAMKSVALNAVPIAPAYQAAQPPPAQPAVAAVVPAPPPAAAPEAAPIAFGAPVVRPAPKPFAVQLGSSPSLDEIRLNWTQLAEENKDALRNLQPRVASTQTQAAGTTYDLIAGPVKSAVDARKICKTLAARGIDCKVSPFAGEAL